VALDPAGRAQFVLPAFRIWTAQHISPAFWRWSPELILILCSVGAAQHIVPVFRVRPAEFILISWSVRAAQQIPCVPIWLWFTIAIRHLYLLALNMW